MDIARKKILVIDDDNHALDTIGEALDSAGFDVLKASSGQDGLDTIQSKDPDLIILDLLMPHMDGIEVLGRLRHSQRGKNIPVIVLTNANDNERLSTALELGVDEYLIKSNVHLNDIIEKIKRILGA